MGVAVAVVPRLFVAVVTTWGNQPIEYLRQVALKSRFKLDRADRAGAADIEHVRRANGNATTGNDLRNTGGDVLQVAMAGRFDRELLLVHHCF